MRRKDREMNENFALSVADKCEWAVLSMITPDGKPYGLALNIVRDGNKIYFHSAKMGKKVDCLKANPYGSFFCTGDTKLVPEEFTTLFESAVICGKLTEVTEDEEKIHALKLICEKYALSNMANFDDAIKRSLKVTGVWKMDIESATGKLKAPKE